MRPLLIGGALGVLIVSLAACGGSNTNSEAEQAMQRDADRYLIETIAKRWHQATSRQDVNLMMSLWAPNATWTVKPGRTLVGKKEIRRYLLTESAPFKPENRWVSLSAMYKIRITASGDRGTLYFECHYVDLKTHDDVEKQNVLRSTGADQEVAKINGRWLITSMVGAAIALRA
jgi:ketosteroid isomerase-like protein